MPLDLSANNSPIASQWLEDQKVDFHFSKGEDRLRLESFQLTDAAGTPIPHRFEANRIVPLEPIQTDRRAGDSIVVEMNYAFRLPLGIYNGFGRHEWGGFLHHIHPRLSLCSAGSSIQTHWMRSGALASEPARYTASISLPSAYLAASNAPLADARLERWRAGDYSSIAKPHQINFATALLDDWVLVVGPKLRWLDTPVDQAQAIAVDGSDLPRNPERVATLEREFSAWYAEETGHGLPKIKTILYGKGLPGQFQADGLWIDRELTRPYDAVDYAYRRSLHGLGSSKTAQMEPFAHSGLARFLAFRFVEEEHPEYTLSGPFRNTLLASFFDTDALPLSYQNQILYLFLARQGIDQSVVDSAGSYTRGGWDALFEAKSSMHLNYLSDRMGPRNFSRGLNAYIAQQERSVRAFRGAMQRFSVYPLSGFFDTVLTSNQPFDVRILKQERCPSIQTVSYRQKRLMADFPIEGVSETGISTIDWQQARGGRQNSLFPQGDYTHFEVANPLRYAELNGKDNRLRTGSFKGGIEALRFQPYTGPENPHRTQIFWLPTLGYNAYDQLTFGLSIYNSTLIPKRLEYRIIPEYSTGTGELIGYASVSSTWPLFRGPVQSIESGLYYRRYHYDVERAYNRFSPGIKLNFRKPNPRSPLIQSLALRYVLVDLEDVESVAESDPGTVEYSVFNARYELEDTRILRPLALRFDVQLADDFGKLGLEVDRRWMLNNRKWFIARFFAGVFVYDQSSRDDVFGFGLSGTRDYLFDYAFIGRSDPSGLWSRQLFATDGGLKTIRSDYSAQSLLAVNASLPIWKFFGLFGDAAYRPESGQWAWDYGLRFAPLTDFLEIYLPIQSDLGNSWTQVNYTSTVSFLIDVRLDALIRRARRGYY